MLERERVVLTLTLFLICLVSHQTMKNFTYFHYEYLILQSLDN